MLPHLLHDMIRAYDPGSGTKPGDPREELGADNHIGPDHVVEQMRQHIKSVADQY